MKKITLLLLFLAIAYKGLAVGLTLVETDKVSFYNYSSNNYDMANHILTVGNTQYNVSGLVVLSGSLASTPGMITQLALVSAIAANQGSIAFWAPGTSFPNPNAVLLVDFVQWGAAGQPFEAQAVAAGKWQAGTFVSASLPIARSSNFGLTGAGQWYSSLGVLPDYLKEFVKVYPQPFADELNLKFEQGHPYQEVLMYNLLGELLYRKNVMQTQVLVVSAIAFKPGIYLVELRKASGDGTVMRIVKR
jgi:hypothetical protein